jgi:hypothetical protein
MLSYFLKIPLLILSIYICIRTYEIDILEQEFLKKSLNST